MNIISRLLAVAILLGSLAYGSYAVGRYVLSEKLFGSSVDVQPSSNIISEGTARVTKLRSSAQKGTAPIEVTVLPASQAGPGPSVSSLKELQNKEIAPRSSSRTKLVNPNNVGTSGSRRSRSTINPNISGGARIRGESGVLSDDDSRPSRRRRSRRLRDDDESERREEERPRRRRRKRKRRSETTSAVAESSTRSRSTRSESSRSESSRSDSGSERNSSDDSSSSRRSRSSNEAPARSQSSSSDSSSSGGDSPVPQSF